jgi:predicted Fe-S protein YdhL (DUF1289 family)
MTHFTPCQGKSACRDNGTICLTCGRGLAEIMQLRELLNEITDLAIQHEYENIDEFAHYIARKLTKMINHRREEQTA